MSIKLLHCSIHNRMPIPKLKLFNRDFSVFVPENWLVIYYEH